MPEYVLGQSPVFLKKVFTNVGGGETGAVKFDLSALPPVNGKAVTRLSIREVRWACEGISVRVLFDRGTPNPAEPMILSGQGERLKHVGPIKDHGTGNTGDIQFTTVGTGNYWIEMDIGIHTD